MGKCITPDCGNDEKHRELHLCEACYSWHRKWAQRPTKEQQARHGALKRLFNRADELTGGKTIVAKSKPRGH